MEKIVKAYEWPNLKKIYLSCTKNYIKLNKIGANWLNCRYVRLETNPKGQLLIAPVDGRSKLKYAICGTLTLQDHESLNKLTPKRVASGSVKEIKLYGEIKLMKDGSHAIVFNLE